MTALSPAHFWPGVGNWGDVDVNGILSGSGGRMPSALFSSQARSGALLYTQAEFRGCDASSQ